MRHCVAEDSPLLKQVLNLIAVSPLNVKNQRKPTFCRSDKPELRRGWHRSQPLRLKRFLSEQRLPSPTPVPDSYNGRTMARRTP